MKLVTFNSHHGEEVGLFLNNNIYPLVRIDK